MCIVALGSKRECWPLLTKQISQHLCYPRGEACLLLSKNIFSSLRFLVPGVSFYCGFFLYKDLRKKVFVCCKLCEFCPLQSQQSSRINQWDWLGWFLMMSCRCNSKRLEFTILPKSSAECPFLGIWVLLNGWLDTKVARLAKAGKF